MAQNGINYKAIIKVASANSIANNLATVQFTILQGVNQTNVYQKTHLAPYLFLNYYTICKLKLFTGFAIINTFKTVAYLKINIQSMLL